MFRISRHGREPVVDVDSVEQIEPAISESKLERFHVDEIRAHDDAFLSGHTSRAWGTAIRLPSGNVALKPYLYVAHSPIREDESGRAPRRCGVGTKHEMGRS
jgi:hypothetical protein